MRIVGAAYDRAIPFFLIIDNFMYDSSNDVLFKQSCTLK